MRSLFTCDITNDSICLKCDTCKIKALIIKDEIKNINDELSQKFIQYRFLEKKFYKHIIEEFRIGKYETTQVNRIITLSHLKRKIRLATQSINLRMSPILDDTIKKYKREENLKNILDR